MSSCQDTDIQALLTRIGWEPRELARRLGVQIETVKGWSSGRRAPPRPITAWLHQIADGIGAVGDPPSEWGR